MHETVWVRLMTAQAEAAKHDGILDIILETRGVVLGVLLVLLGTSLVSWFIIGYKMFYLQRARAETVKFLDIFWQSKRLDEIYQYAEQYERSPVSHVFKAGHLELTKLKGNEADAGHLQGIDNVERALRRAQTSEITQLESRLPFLATVGSNAPFVGLFGTVWGIMVAFTKISSQGAAGIDVVAGPIAEALIVTAVGLFAAIPAGVAYNYFLSKIKVLNAEMENFSNDFLNITKRHFFK